MKQPAAVRTALGPWIEAFGEADLIGGWAEVELDPNFAALVDGPVYHVFLTSYDPVQLFVQNRTGHSFEIHALPNAGTGRLLSVHCGYQIVGRRLGKTKRIGRDNR